MQRPVEAPVRRPPVERLGEGRVDTVVDLPRRQPAAPGRPLDTVTRRRMEARFGDDFGSVRVHTDRGAAASADAAAAQAYTVGDEITFSRGSYRPATTEGLRLLAHELAHVVQQLAVPSAGRSSPTRRPPRPRLNGSRAGSWWGSPRVRSPPHRSG
jgi:hypothetical protein